MYSIQEKVWWVKKYGAGKSFRKICELFHNEFPNRPKPSHTTVMRMCAHFEETGCVVYQCIGTHPNCEVSENDLVILVNVNLRASTREMSRLTGVFRRLHKYRYHPYKSSSHQELQTGDCERRMEYTSTLFEMNEEDPNLLQNILFTDEKIFTLHHEPNPQNTRH